MQSQAQQPAWVDSLLEDSDWLLSVTCVSNTDMTSKFKALVSGVFCTHTAPVLHLQCMVYSYLALWSSEWGVLWRYCSPHCFLINTKYGNSDQTQRMKGKKRSLFFYSLEGIWCLEFNLPSLSWPVHVKPTLSDPSPETLSNRHIYHHHVRILR